MLVAPWRQHLAFSFGSSVGGSGDLDDIRHTERLQLANLPCGRILVRQFATDELVVFPTRWVGKNCNSRRDTILYEICRFESPRAARFMRIRR